MRYESILKALGAEITGEVLICNRHYKVARIPTTFSELTVTFSDNGTARLDKPNGTTKWIYEKTPAQFRRVIMQTLSFYKLGGTR